MAETVTIPQIAAALGITDRGARKRADAGAWAYTERPTRGGRQRVFAIADLPREIRDALVLHHLTRSTDTSALQSSELPLPAPIAPASLAPARGDGELKAWQRDIMLARLALVREAERLARHGGLLAAYRALAAAAAAGTLPPELARAAAAANARRGESRTLSAATLRRWRDELGAAEGRADVLAPKASPHEATLPPAWMADFLDFYALPSKPSITRALGEMKRAKPEIRLPAVRTVQAEVAKLPAIERARGRMGPRALRQLKAFVRRDVSELWPTAVYVTDGHTHHCFVRNPMSGRPFRPEITGTIDVVTRRITGWSVALAENTHGTIDALRHAFTTAGVPDIWYVDRGSGLNNHVLDDRLTGLLARFDVEKHNSLAYRAQARGVIERFHENWIEAGRLMPGYAGDDMDPEARKAFDRQVEADLAAHGHSELLQDWDAFTLWCRAKVTEYNARPHSFLPKIGGRHMSPDEMWDSWRQRGWAPDVVADEEAEALFRPQERRQTRRGEVQLFSNRYFAPALEEWHERDVLVGYDIHDARRVWVSTLEGRLICEAIWHGNSVSYFPKSVAERAHEKRVENQVQRALKRVEKAGAERQAPIIEIAARNDRPIEVSARPEPALQVAATVPDERPPAIEPRPEVPEQPAQPRFTSDVDLVKWLLAHPDRVTSGDARHLADRLRAKSFVLRLSVDGIDAAAVGTLITKKLKEAATS